MFFDRHNAIGRFRGDRSDLTPTRSAAHRQKLADLNAKSRAQIQKIHRQKPHSRSWLENDWWARIPGSGSPWRSWTGRTSWGCRAETIVPGSWDDCPELNASRWLAEFFEGPCPGHNSWRALAPIWTKYSWRCLGFCSELEFCMMSYSWGTPTSVCIQWCDLQPWVTN